MISNIIQGLPVPELFRRAFGQDASGVHGPATDSGPGASGNAGDRPLTGRDGNDAAFGGDMVAATEGNDQMTVGSDDTATGGGVEDLFETGDWVAPGAPATITDYDPDEDVIAYSFEGEPPQITTEIDEHGTATLLADGQAFLIVLNASPDFSAAEFVLQPH